MANIVKINEIRFNWRAVDFGSGQKYDCYVVGCNKVIAITEHKNGYQIEFDDLSFQIIYNPNHVFYVPVEPNDVSN